jgi:nicotinamidase-related amidase
MKGSTMSDPRNSKAGLDALLTPDNCVLILIDHQPFQVAGLRSHDTQSMINNVVGLAKSAKIFGVPTLFTTVLERQGGYLLKPLQDVFPDQKPIDRTFINTWEDVRVVDWVKARHAPCGEESPSGEVAFSRRVGLQEVS